MAVTVDSTFVVITVVVSATELLEFELELLEDPAGARTPPAAPPGGEVDVVAFLALAWKASSVFPVAGALMDPVMPFWQWLPVVWPQ